MSVDAQTESLPQSRRGFMGWAGRSSLGIAGFFASVLSRPAAVAAHDQDCTLALPHNPNCGYNCWRYSGYSMKYWTSPSGHNYCLECTQSSSCWFGPFLCSQWGHT